VIANANLLMASLQSAVWRWQRHYAEEGVERLLREGSRKPGKAPVAVATVAKVLALTSADPPAETTHWTSRAMAKAANLSLRTVQRIWGPTSWKAIRLTVCS
jgi:hypothetical protein